MNQDKKKNYTEEFRKSSAQLAVDSDQPISKTAADLDINETTLYNWVSKYCPKKDPAPANLDSMHQELQKLRKENARLTQERDILKKAAAYFASEM